MPYDVDTDPYLSEDTDILQNLLGIRRQDELDTAEAEITSVEISMLMIEEKPSTTDFNWDLLCIIHRRLFSEIYEWAGKPRVVEITKGTTSFARVQYLNDSAQDIFQHLAVDNYLQDLDFDAFIKQLAHYYADLNVLHPFREGNGRVIRTFIAMLAASLGYEVAWNSMDSQENIDACIAAYNGDEAPLQSMLRAIVTPINISERDEAIPK